MLAVRQCLLCQMMLGGLEPEAVPWSRDGHVEMLWQGEKNGWNQLTMQRTVNNSFTPCSPLTHFQSLSVDFNKLGAFYKTITKCQE